MNIAGLVATLRNGADLKSRPNRRNVRVCSIALLAIQSYRWRFCALQLWMKFDTGGECPLDKLESTARNGASDVSRRDDVHGTGR